MVSGAAVAMAFVGVLFLGLGWCVWRYLRRPHAPSFGGRLPQAVGLLAFSALLASVVQLVAASLGWIWSSTSFTPLGLAAALPLSWLVLCGGWSVQAVFEALLDGRRRDVLMDNWHVYAALTALQMLVLAVLVAWRWRRSDRTDLLPRSVFVLAVANGIAGMAWPWWGT